MHAEYGRRWLCVSWSIGSCAQFGATTANSMPADSEQGWSH